MKTSRIPLLLACAILSAGLLGCGTKKSQNPNPDGSATPTEDVEQTHNFPAPEPQPGTPEDRGEIPGDTVRKRLEARLQPVFFAFDKYDLSSEARATLTANAAALRETPGFDVTVEGHCDERGTNEYNLALGDKRARAARDFLVSSGIAASRFTIVSYGEERPFEYGHEERAWSQNRRAHFRVPEPR